MRIQPDYVCPSYRQPAFKADFDYKDPDTRDLLKWMVYAHSSRFNPEHVWTVIQNLKKNEIGWFT